MRCESGNEHFRSQESGEFVDQLVRIHSLRVVNSIRPTLKIEGKIKSKRRLLVSLNVLCSFHIRKNAYKI